MDTLVNFKREMIAPCGINCGTCIGHLRDKNKCCGCWPETGFKPYHCSACSIKNCEYLNNTTSGFCYDCEKFPCQRLKQLDKRYKNKYHISLIQNQLKVKEIGMENFLAAENTKWTCPVCGSVLSVHRENCMNCFI
jgi:hypothetical protein